jgi:hypothetical protein
MSQLLYCSVQSAPFGGAYLPLNVELATDLAQITRAVLRAPLVDLRLLLETRAGWAPALAAGLLVALVWWQDRRDRTVP